MTNLIIKFLGIQSSKLMVERLNNAGIEDIYVTDRGGVVVGGEAGDMKKARAAAKRIVASDSLKAESMSKGN